MSELSIAWILAVTIPTCLARIASLEYFSGRNSNRDFTRANRWVSGYAGQPPETCIPFCSHTCLQAKFALMRIWFIKFRSCLAKRESCIYQISATDRPCGRHHYTRWSFKKEFERPKIRCWLHIWNHMIWNHGYFKECVLCIHLRAFARHISQI